MPKRIQRRRVKGWRMPPGAVCIDRPSRWGNPYTVERWGRNQAIALYRATCEDGWNPAPWKHLSDADYSEVARLRDAFRERFLRYLLTPREAARAELRGHDLACWCAPDQPCHGDVLLAISNSKDVANGEME